MTRSASISAILATHEALATTPQAWFDVSLGLVSAEAAARAVSAIESPTMIERSKALFAPPSAAQERAIRARILNAAVPARHSRWWIAGGLASAAALLLALWLRPPEEGEEGRGLDAEYRVELSAGWEAVRGGAADGGLIPTFRLDQRVGFTLRPMTAIAATELDVVVVAYDERGRGMRLGAPRRLVTTTGTVRFSERLDTMGLTPGTWRLGFVIGRPGQVPDDVVPVASEQAGADEAAYRVAHGTIHVIDIDEP